MSGPPFYHNPNLASQEPYDEVYTGFWINHIHGRFYGATLTLNRQQGSFLISFLALFVGTVGKSFWKILRYGLHHTYSLPKIPDGVYHQRQAVLCNTPSALDTVLSLVNIGWAWRRRATKLAWRLFPSLTLALVVSVGFTLAGIFSSSVAFDDANEVLLSGKHCGSNPSENGSAGGAYTKAITQYRNIKFTEYLSYAIQCYQQPESIRSGKCQKYIRTKLPYTIDTNASCPFAKGVCLSQDGNIKLDTGLLDSDKDFGINGGQHFLFRLVRHCAPIVTEGHTLPSSDQTLGYNFDINDYNRSTFRAPVFPVNETADKIRKWVLERGGDFKTGAMIMIPDEVGNTSLPLAATQTEPTDADVFLIFLSAPGIIYDRKITDPWFSATTPINITTFGAMTGNEYSEGTEEYYISDQPATVLGCTSQQYFCNPDLPSDVRCIRYPGSSSFHDDISRVWPDPLQRGALKGEMMSMYNQLNGDLDHVYKFPGLPALMARFNFDPGWGVVVMEDAERQWQKEMEFTFQAYLLSLQSSLLDIVKGVYPLPKSGFCEPQEACASICKNLKIRSPQHYSFSVLGVSIILTLGGAVMLIGTFLEELVAVSYKLRRRKSSRSYAQLEWKTNSVLQLQRIIYEGIGVGTWSNALDAVPVTEKGAILGVLDASDSNHPRLIHPQASSRGHVGDGQNISSEQSSVKQAPSSHLSVSPAPSVSSNDNGSFKIVKGFRGFRGFG